MWGFFYSLLEQIPMMFGDTRETESVLGPVVQAGLDALKVRWALQCCDEYYRPAACSRVSVRTKTTKETDQKTVEDIEGN